MKAEADRAEAERSAHPVSVHVGQARPRTLLVLSSANQLYSGTGRALFETFSRLTGLLQLELAIDEADTRNLELAGAFCHAHNLPLHTAPAIYLRGAPDSASSGIAELLADRVCDLVVTVSWANAATNREVLEVIGDCALGYLPLHQPTWTVPLEDDGQRVVEEVHLAMVRRADAVICASPWERQTLNALAAPELPRCSVVPLGCDFSRFKPAERSTRDLLFVGDHREPRKRFDRVVAVLERLAERNVDARLLVVGNESERSIRGVPESIADRVVQLGYVSEERLAEAYGEAAILLLLSEYEAFGLPIVEALASATPVVMTPQPAPASLFSKFDGVYVVPPDDAEQTASVVADVLERANEVRAQLIDQHRVLVQTFDWSSTATRIYDQLLAGWSHRRRMSDGFAPMIAPAQR